MTVYRVTYWYRGEKYDGGTFDSEQEAQERTRKITWQLPGATGITVTPQQHTHHKYCGH